MTAGPTPNPNAIPSATPISTTSDERFALLPTTRHLAPLSVLIGLVLTALGGPGRLIFAAVTAVLFALTLYTRHRRPELVVDAEGYRVEVAGTVRFVVRFAEVIRVLCDRSEGALYLDCGDRARNLLLPPSRGYPFTFARRERLFQVLVQAVPDKLVEVERLDNGGAGLPSQP